MRRSATLTISISLVMRSKNVFIAFCPPAEMMPAPSVGLVASQSFTFRKHHNHAGTNESSPSAKYRPALSGALAVGLDRNGLLQHHLYQYHGILGGGFNVSTLGLCLHRRTAVQFYETLFVGGRHARRYERFLPA